MPIRPPALDDRGFDDLVAELTARIPAHTPEWTNPRPGDPGVTLIELFAWLADTILYRANLIPERQRLAFLRLLGMTMRPAAPARGVVALTIDAKDSASAIELPIGSGIAKPLPFETLDELTVLPVTARAYYKRRLGSDEQQEFAQLLPDLGEVYALDGTPVAYVTTPIFIDGAAEANGFDLVADTLDRFNIVGKKDLYPSQLSGGQQQLVGIARAVIHRPSLLLADEPTGNLQSGQARKIMELFRQLNDDGATIVQVTHSDANARYGTRTIELRDGWISSDSSEVGAGRQEVQS